MKKIMFLVVLLVSAICLNAQSFTKLSIKLDMEIFDKEGHVQINLPKTLPATIEYFIDVYPDKTVEVGALGAPTVSYTKTFHSSIDTYPKGYIEITINNFVVADYNTAGQIHWNGPDYYDYDWYFNNSYHEPGSVCYIYRNSTLEMRLRR